MSHDFIEVGDRRWCITCDLFQTRKKGMAFFPTPAKPCPKIYGPHNKRFENMESDTWPLTPDTEK